MRVDKSRTIEFVTLDDRVFEPLKDWSRKNQCVLYLGSVPLKIDNQIYNSTVWIDKEGRAHAPYQKIHLFDIHLQGQEPILESAEFKHGSAPAVEFVNDWKVGLSICYDLRFSELYHKYQKMNVDVIGVPSAFLVKTGQAHWHTLLRARAIESQAFVIAAAQQGLHKGMRETFGHSLVIDPWGVILAEALDGQKILYAELKHDRLAEVRRQIPMSSHRRL